MTDNHIASWIQVFELLILIYEWTQLESITRDSVLKMEWFLPNFMEKYKDTIKRTKGHGMKIIKFHMMKRLCNDILRLGPPRVYYGGSGENMLKEKNKRFARRAKNRGTFWVNHCYRGCGKYFTVKG